MVLPVVGGDQRVLRAALLQVGVAAGKGVGDFAEGGLDRLFVAGDFFLLAGLRDAELRRQAASVEKRYRDLGATFQAPMPLWNRRVMLLLAVPFAAVIWILGRTRRGRRRYRRSLRVARLPPTGCRGGGRSCPMAGRPEHWGKP
jgi:hypothetical protein